MEVVPLVLPAWHRDTLHAPPCSAVGRGAEQCKHDSSIGPCISSDRSSCKKLLQTIVGAIVCEGTLYLHNGVFPAHP